MKPDLGGGPRREKGDAIVDLHPWLSGLCGILEALKSHTFRV